MDGGYLKRNLKSICGVFWGWPEYFRGGKMLDLSVTGGQDGCWTETWGDKDTQAGVTLLINKTF